jgi:hypothetical protein
VQRKSSDRVRADAAFDRIWRPVDQQPAASEAPAPETRLEKTSRLKATRLEAERKADKED